MGKHGKEVITLIIKYYKINSYLLCMINWFLISKYMFIYFMDILKKLVGLHNINKIWTVTKKFNKIWTLTRKVNSITLKLNPNMAVPCEGGILILQSYLKEDFCPS